jgi:hypothetical protein
MDRFFIFEHAVLAEDAYRFLTFRPDVNLAAAFGAGCNDVYLGQHKAQGRPF